MPCGCAKKKSNSVHFTEANSKEIPDSTEWGPILWKYLHSLTEKIGFLGNRLLDSDQANHMEYLITSLHLIIPCTECQSHAANYLSLNPFPSLKDLHGEELRSTIRNWLFSFHNHVRISKGQPIIVTSAKDCVALYSQSFVPKCEYSLFVQNVGYAVRQGWVRIENWRKWYSHSERLRILLGNVVV
jgi:hypothetical protein